MSAPNLDQNWDQGRLNSSISYDEVSVAIDKTKFKKSYLVVPNEALKSRHAKILLHSFFNLCFSSGFSPTDWDDTDDTNTKKRQGCT